MRESRSYGSVGERGGNEPLYPELPVAQLPLVLAVAGELLKILRIKRHQVNYPLPDQIITI